MTLQHQNNEYSLEDAWALTILVLFWCWFLFSVKANFSLSLVDDAYIFLRVVENILSGEGWTYNPQWPDDVNPLTSPLFPLIVLLFRKSGLGGEASLISVYLLALFVLSLIQYVGFRHLGKHYAILISILTVASGVLIKSFGMETSLFLVCIAGTALAYQKGAYKSMGLLAGCTALTRPEGIALLFIVVFLSWLRGQRVPVTSAAIGLSVLLPWVLFSAIKFGSVLPHTVGIKAAQAELGWWAAQGSWLLGFLRQPVHEFFSYTLSALGLWSMFKQCQRGEFYAMVIVLFGVVQVSAYSILKAPVGYFWYYAPGNLALDTLIVLGVVFLCKELVVKHIWKENLKFSSYIGSFLLAPIILLLVELSLTTTPFKKIKEYRLAHDYRNVALQIAEHTPPSAVVAATEIGYIGYYSGRTILDMHGLLSSNALPFIKRGEIDWWFVNNEPEIIIAHRSPWYGEPGTKEWPESSNDIFKKNYKKVYEAGNVRVFSKIK